MTLFSLVVLVLVGVATWVLFRVAGDPGAWTWYGIAAYTVNIAGWFGASRYHGLLADLAILASLLACATFVGVVLTASVVRTRGAPRTPEPPA